MKKFFFLFLFLIFSFFAQARSVSVAWNANPETNLTQYRIYRLESATNTRVLLATVPPASTTATISADTGQVIAMTAYNGSLTSFQPLQESALSSSVVVPEAAYVIPPESENWAIVSASSSHPNYPSSNLIDKNLSSLWATDYESSSARLPQTVILDMGKVRNAKGWSYTPRQDGLTSGHLENWKISFSVDNIVWTEPISGTFSVNDKTAKVFAWTNEIPARFMRLECLTEITNQTWHVVAAEISIIEVQPPLPPPAPSQPTGLKVSTP